MMSNEGWRMKEYEGWVMKDERLLWMWEYEGLRMSNEGWRMREYEWWVMKGEGWENMKDE